MNIPAEVQAAADRIEPFVRRTPVEPSHWLGAEGACQVHLKLENYQRTGSFKFRGAMNKLLTIPGDVRRRGVVAASTGNHGAAVACGAAEMGCPAMIFAPENAIPSKLETIRAYGIDVVCVGDDCLQAEAAARDKARDNGLTYISPYNDPLIIAGQGTIGHELEQQLGEIDVVYIAVGGGGLVSGVGGYLKSLRPDCRIIGASPMNSAVMRASLEAGRVLDLASEPTLSDGTAGGVEPDSITFDLCRDIVDEFVLVSEEEIEEALRGVVASHHMLIEGAAAVAVAAFRAQGDRFAGKRAVVLLCGANIDPAVLKSVLR